MSSSTKSVSIMTRNCEIPLDQIKKSKKDKSMKEVVLHQPAPSPPTQDWVLFPEDVIVDKYSIRREARSRKVASATETARPNKVSPAEEKMEKAIANAQEYIKSRSQNEHLSEACSHRRTKALADLAFQKSDVTPRQLHSRNRLPTPDLSDAEEDDLWSCCATSESSACMRCNFD